MRTLSLNGLQPTVRKLAENGLADGLPRTLPLGEPLAQAREPLLKLSAETLGESPPASYPDAQGLLAGLWLLYDFMPESHAISQDLHTAEGSYWHAILHRREPDASNARYWFGRVGDHALFAELNRDAREIAALHPQADLKGLADQKAWDPDEFVARCTRPSQGATLDALLALQQREWALLFDYNLGRAYPSANR